MDLLITSPDLHALEDVDRRHGPTRDHANAVRVDTIWNGPGGVRGSSGRGGAGYGRSHDGRCSRATPDPGEPKPEM